jgi:hypothetical protein
LAEDNKANHQAVRSEQMKPISPYFAPRMSALAFNERGESRTIIAR